MSKTIIHDLLKTRKLTVGNDNTTGLIVNGGNNRLGSVISGAEVISFNVPIIVGETVHSTELPLKTLFENLYSILDTVTSVANFTGGDLVKFEYKVVEPVSGCNIVTFSHGTTTVQTGGTVIALDNTTNYLLSSLISVASTAEAISGITTWKTQRNRFFNLTTDVPAPSNGIVNIRVSLVYSGYRTNV
jgi:hypothetical protein